MLKTNTVSAPAAAGAALKINKSDITAAAAAGLLISIASNDVLTKAAAAEFLPLLEAAGARALQVSRRNKKLVPDKKTAFIIWSLPAQDTCPGATTLCKKYCYAKKAEIMYKDVLPARYRALQESADPAFILNMIYTILKIYAGTRKEKIVFRIHESGDFYNQLYADRWLLIMAALQCVPGLNFIAYTKSFSFFDGRRLPDNFSLRASIWSDTAPADLETIEKNHWPIYTAVKEFTPADTFARCRCSDCAKCSMCWNNNIPDIRCKIH